MVEHLEVPGYSTPPSAGDFSIKSKILITSDGRYLVTVVAEPWPKGKDATVDVIDLQIFHLVTTQRRSEYGLGSNLQLDAKGDSLQVHGLTPSPSKPVGSKEWLAFLSLPSLRPIERCDYSVVFNPPNSVTVLRAEFDGTPSPACAREAQSQLTHQNEPDELQKLGSLLESACGVDAVTPDHHYTLGTCRDCHQSLFGVSCKSEGSEVYDVDF